MENTKIISQQATPDYIENLVKKLIPDEELNPGSIDEVINLPAFYEKLQQCEHIVKKHYSEIDHGIQNALVLRRLQQITNILRLNPLWKERIEQSGLQAAPQTFEEWQQLPLSDKNTMQEFYMGSRPGLVVPLNHGGYEIVASGGTSSSSPVETVYSLQELQDTYKIAGIFMGKYLLPDYLSGDEQKWIFTTYADYQMWSSGTMVGGVLQSIPDINYIAAGPVGKEVFQHILSYEGPKAILGMSQGIAILSDLGAGLHEDARNALRLALYCSGLLPDRNRIELKKLYPNLEILSYFSATEAEAIAMQLTPNSAYLATVPGLHFIEVVDSEGRWVNENEEGELVITRLHTHQAPLLRLKMGDRVIRRPVLNDEGLKTQQFEFKGRSGDIIHITDSQCAANKAYEFICVELKKAGVCDLNVLAHEVQFNNNWKTKDLKLIVAVDDVQALTTKIHAILRKDGVKRLFMSALMNAMSLFSKGEANFYAIEKFGYHYAIQIVPRKSDEIYRTVLGKAPLIRDIV